MNDIFYSLIKACVYLVSFVVSFEAMKCINYEKFLKKGHVAQAQVFYCLCVVALAYLVGSFVMVFIR